MNNRLVLFFCLALIFSTSRSIAQLSKQEKKEWKKKAREFKQNPETLKELTEDKEAAEGQVSSLNDRVAQLQSSMSNKDARIAELEDQLLAALRDKQ